ncbi:UDP-N-acetylmuramate dehydrogenase [Demequina muriae]|uniref:UDP-N-acetylenolpyruvoylglucosamine reductase n=1 Tax=Demequina muriae TaxID=3051664 RepID=A0ABT8GHA2_9MICO|nr:UDP-N-acetylmuramate dehydrogenase [Demequina sp. EGI L300058]MDN4480805.1 UDP-N-acetylmuramate dehydrogenase [Demequina sp. EGI L300058]
MTRLADLTTLRVGGPVGRLVEAGSERDLIDAVRDADRAGEPVLVLGGGSNLLAGDDGFAGVVVRDARSELSVQDDGMCGGVSITATAGMRWDDVVSRAVHEGWVGIESLSGIPGSTGATPVQNVGAYGAEVSDVIALVRVWDRLEERVRSLARIDCGFGYRDSVLKRSMRGLAPDGGVWHPTPRYVVLDVTFQMRQGTRSGPIRYAQLADALGIAPGERAPIDAVREAVLRVRGAKGMVLDDADPDTWSAGSFFTNPVLTADAAAGLPEEAPWYPAVDGAVKTSAAWLIEQAGFSRGFASPGSAAAVSTKHTLALTNRGGATAGDVAALARTVRDGVRDRFGITLVPEPVLLGVDL